MNLGRHRLAWLAGGEKTAFDSSSLHFVAKRPHKHKDNLFVYVCSNTYTSHACMYVCIYIYVFIEMYTYTYTCIQRCVYRYIKYTHVDWTCKYVYTYITGRYAYIDMYICIRASGFLFGSRALEPECRILMFVWSLGLLCMLGVHYGWSKLISKSCL